MQMKSIKRGIAIILAITITLALCACVPGAERPDNTATYTGDGATLFDDSVELSIIVGSHPSWPYDENFLFWKYFREAVGGTLNVSAIPNTEFDTKLSLMMASPSELPDLIHMLNKETSDDYASVGAFIPIDDYIDKMPNYTAFWNSIPEDERDKFQKYRLSSDGKTYFPQVYGNERGLNLQVWMYREDIFNKHGLNPPKTLDEMYEVGLKLKEIYPDSYPVCLRQGFGKINTMGPQFKPYFRYNLHYDFPNQRWSYGACEPVMLDMVKYLIKLRDAKLLPPDYLTINIKTWEELVSTDRGFMMTEYMVRFDFFNIPNRKKNPEYKWAIMTPPRSENGENKTAKMNVDPTGYVVCNTGNQESILNSIKLVDWMYSDEACELLSWGKEGETYIEENGNRKFMLEEGETAGAKFGAHSYGLYQRIDPAAASVKHSEEQESMMEFALEHIEEEVNPKLWLDLNNEEDKETSDRLLEIDTYVEEMLSKFLLGQEPLSNWDDFQADLKEMGVENLVEIYETAYNRVING